MELAVLAIKLSPKAAPMGQPWDTWLALCFRRQRAIPLEACVAITVLG
jgi:hypothetical protein